MIRCIVCGSVCYSGAHFPNPRARRWASVPVRAGHVD